MKKAGSVICKRCNNPSKQAIKLYGKILCPKCSYEFYKAIKPLIEKSPSMKKEFKKWFFEMEMEEY